MWLIIFILIVITFCYYENNVLDISKFEVKGNISNKLRILHLSDLHSKQFGRRNKNLLKAIINEKPDIIFCTGDMIDSNMKNMNEIIDFLSKLNKLIPVVYIPGNNEVRCFKLYEILFMLKEKGILVLNNEIGTIKIKNIDINILGLVEKRLDKGESFYNKINSRYSYSNCEKLFYELEKRDGLKIVLSHYPENFEFIKENYYCQYNFDFMFSGHAHGGQFILPFVGGLFAPGQGILPKYYNGMHRERLIISRGLGNSGFPLRLFNRPEIVILDIKENK